jgi:hypothetical protein
MKKIVSLVVVGLMFTVLNVYAADSSTFVDLCKTGGIAAIQSMLTTGKVDVNAVAQETGKTALMSACENTTSSAVGIVGLLLNSGANVNATDVLGKTALDYAKNNVKYGDKIVPLLEKAGAVASTVKTLKNSSATVSEMATSAATAAAIKMATSENASKAEIAETAVQAAEQTAASKPKETASSSSSSSSEGGFFSKFLSFFKK